MKKSVLAGLIFSAFSVFAADTIVFEPARPAASPLVAARAAGDAKDWTKAIGLLNQMVRDEPRNADAYNLLGYSYRKQAQPNLPKAFESYQMALKLNPNHKGAHEYIGEAYLMDNQPDEAQKHLVQLEKICGSKSCEEYEDLAKALANFRLQAPRK